MTERTAETPETPETTRRASIAYACAGLGFLLAILASALGKRAGLDPHYAQAIGAFALGLFAYPAIRHMAISQGRAPLNFARWVAVMAAASVVGFILVAPAVEWGLEKLFG